MDSSVASNSLQRNSFAAPATSTSEDTLSKTLQTFLLEPGTTVEAGEEIGHGAYGTVFKIRRWGVVCAAKKFRDFPLQVGALTQRGKTQASLEDSTKQRHLSASKDSPEPDSGMRKRASIINHQPESRVLAKFEKECHLLSNLRHPYIVQFLGIYIDKISSTPIIVMEYLPMSLSACVEKKPLIPRNLQISILSNVALGLAYLHGHSPPIVHRNLTANNILLTSNMVAKVSDLGVARILDLTPKHAYHVMQTPGTAAYMPPEAVSAMSTYNCSLDVFSFGALMVHLISQQWPIPSAAVHVGTNDKLSELERRQTHLDLVGEDHCLYKLITQCLQNDPTHRPNTSSIVGSLSSLQSNHLLPSTSYLDLLQVLETNRNQLEAKGVQLAASKDQLQMISMEIDSKDNEISELKKKLIVMEKRLAGSLKGLLLWGDENSPSNQDKGSISSTPDNLLPTQTSFTWKRDVDMPEGMYGAKGILLDDKIYIGGGDCKDLETERIIFEYDINSVVRKWTALPYAPITYFPLAVVNKFLTLVGGMDVVRKVATNLLTVWNKETQQWGSAFPPMPTSRQDCSSTSHNFWLIVAGGMNLKKPLYNVDLFDSATFQWHTIKPLPRPSMGMNGCVVNGVWYLLGGTNFVDLTRGETGPKEFLFGLNLDENISTNTWAILAETPHYCSTAVPFGEHLMALGGSDTLSSIASSTSMFLYSPSLNRWLFVGGTPTPRSQAICIVLSKSRLIVLGGRERTCKYSKVVEMLHC